MVNCGEVNERWRTSKAWRMSSRERLVQVRWRQAGMLRLDWTRWASWMEAWAVEPLGPHVRWMQDGWSWAIRSRRAWRLANPSVVLGGKYYAKHGITAISSRAWKERLSVEQTDFKGIVDLRLFNQVCHFLHLQFWLVNLQYLRVVLLVPELAPGVSSSVDCFQFSSSAYW